MGEDARREGRVNGANGADGDEAAEERAARTIFFVDRVIDGETRHWPVVYYLALLHLSPEGSTGVFDELRWLAHSAPPDELERDLICLLQPHNWRFHLMACGMLVVVRPPSASLLAELWARLERGSWVSPQLAATAAWIDPDFSRHALALVEGAGTDNKSVVALAHLLSERGELPAPPSPARARAAAAALQDRDSAGYIASEWLQNLPKVCAA